jgi:hypothetical protein
VELAKGKLFVKPAKARVVGCSIMIRLIIGWRLSLTVVWVSLWWKYQRIGWGVLVIRSCPLHGVIYFSRRGLWHRLFAILPHHSFGFEEYWAIFCVVIGIIVVVHALWRLEWVLATDSSST